MPGRQAHGRSLTSDPKSRKGPKPKAKAKAKSVALDAFAIAAGTVPTNQKGVRTRDLDPEPEQKRRRADLDDDDDDDGGEDAGEESDLGNSRAKRRKRDVGDDGSDNEFASDSEGVEWRVGLGEDDDDSEIDSDEAFGESDEERFEGFAFAGSSSKQRTKQNGHSDIGLDDMGSDEEDDGSLGEDAIDLAQALDDFSDDDDSATGSGSGSEEGDSTSNSPDTDDEEDEDVDMDDPTKFDALKSLVSAFSGEDSSGKGAESTSKSKIDLQDLGLFGVKDQNIKKSLKLMKKEERATKPGASKKLDVPLARRHQERLLRVAASEKANKTLDRWLDTVKQNRRADHLVFPLPESLPNAGLDNQELLPLTQRTAGTELEQTIMSIIAESGLAPAAKKTPDDPSAAAAEEDQSISRAELQSLWNERRREREATSREQARAKRIKKIKSKSYRRVHRKELAKIGLQEAEEGGDIDSEEEREAQHRRRATERMGARHRESKWAKSAKKTGRAAWDDDYRAGLTDMARRDEELRRRVEGKASGSEDDDGSEASDSDDEAGKQRLLRELKQVATANDDEPVSNLMKLPFMQRAEAAQRKKNDETIADIMRQMASNSESEIDDEQEEAEIGRRTYGGANTKTAEDEREVAAPKDKDNVSRAKLQARPAAPPAETPKETWSQPLNAKERRRAKRQGRAVESIDVMEAALEIAAPKSKKPAKLSSKLPRPNRHLTTDAPDTSSDEDEGEAAAAARRPLRIRDAEQAEKAFGGDDVELEFAQEKAQMEEQQDDQVIDETLPGWGSWAGEGVSKRAAKRQEKLFQKVVKGVKKTDRKDAKLDRVIISEKRVKKVGSGFLLDWRVHAMSLP